jgi:prolyl oligopeptidase
LDSGLLNDNVSIYAARLNELSGPSTAWRRIATADDQVRAFAVHGDELYLAVARDAPRIKVIKTLLSSSEANRPMTVIPEDSVAVIQDIQAAADGLYVRATRGGPTHVIRLPWNSAKAEEIPLPQDTGIESDGFTTMESTSGVVVIAQSWISSPTVLRFDPEANKVLDAGIQTPPAVDFSDIQIVETAAAGTDGTLIPLTILHRRGIALDGSHPTLLDGYGAYGDVRIPEFDRMRRVWFDHGGIYAVAHVRGGGEFGEAWHAAGMLANKPNTFLDFIACAEYLVKNGYTSPWRLAGTGYSAGGIAIGNAITRRPDLFGVALITVGMTNALRFEQMPIGSYNTFEFGSVSTEQGFRMLMAIDAYHHVVDGVAYPAVLISTALKDARVSLWQSGKMAARLQSATSSGKPVLLRLDIEGGHLGVGTKTQVEETIADQYTFLLWQFGIDGFERNSR